MPLGIKIIDRNKKKYIRLFLYLVQTLFRITVVQTFVKCFVVIVMYGRCFGFYQGFTTGWNVNKVKKKKKITY